MFAPISGLKGDELVKQLFLLLMFLSKEARGLPHAAVVDERRLCAGLAVLSHKLKDIAHTHTPSVSQQVTKLRIRHSKRATSNSLLDSSTPTNDRRLFTNRTLFHIQVFLLARRNA